MKYYDLEDKQTDKIPYDKEPILRQSSYKKSKVNTSGGGVANKALAVVVCVLVLINLILGGLFVSTIRNRGENVNYTTINISSSSASNVSAVANKAKLSVVCVHAGFSTTTEDTSYQGFFNMVTKGSGVIFEDDKANGSAYIVTCYHVIKGYDSKVYVLLYDSFTPIKAKTIYYSTIYDIAVLQIENSSEYKSSSATYADIADSSLLVEGDMAVAIGNPLASGISVTDGIISKTTDLLNIDSTIHRVIRTSAAINSGNSGGGLFNASGELIGIVNAKTTDNPSANKYVDNVAYAIPSNVAISLAYNIIRNTKPVKAVLGFGMLVSSSGISFNLINDKLVPVQQVVVSSVDAGSAAQEAGFEINDEVVGFVYGDTVVNMINIYTFDDHAFNINLGDEVRFTVIRNGVTKELTVKVTEVVSADLQNWYGS